MKVQIILSLLFLAALNCYSQDDKSADQYFTNAYHNMNSIVVKNADGTRSTININGSSATLVNADGTSSTIDFVHRKSLLSIDGTFATVHYNGMSTTVVNSDGSQYVIYHKVSASSSSTAYGYHVVNHNVGNCKERAYQDYIDILIHQNWMVRMRAAKFLAEVQAAQG